MTESFVVNPLTDPATLLRYCISLVSSISGRSIEPKAAAVEAVSVFPSGLVPEKDLAGILAKVEAMGSQLAGCDGPITADELSKVIGGFKTPYCPPASEAYSAAAEAEN
jgi:hypothetical protein